MKRGRIIKWDTAKQSGIILPVTAAGVTDYFGSDIHFNFRQVENAQRKDIAERKDCEYEFQKSPRGLLLATKVVLK